MLSSAYHHLELIFSFGEVYRRFTSVECTVMFLNELEPCVLNDKLKKYYPRGHGVFYRTRYHLHMDITIIDFGSILTSLRETKCTQLSFMYMQVGRIFFYSAWNNLSYIWIIISTRGRRPSEKIGWGYPFSIRTLRIQGHTIHPELIADNLLAQVDDEEKHQMIIDKIMNHRVIISCIVSLLTLSLAIFLFLFQWCVIFLYLFP